MFRFFYPASRGFSPAWLFSVYEVVHVPRQSLKAMQEINLCSEGIELSTVFNLSGNRLKNGLICWSVLCTTLLRVCKELLVTTRNHTHRKIACNTLPSKNRCVRTISWKRPCCSILVSDLLNLRIILGDGRFDCNYHLLFVSYISYPLTQKWGDLMIFFFFSTSMSSPMSTVQLNTTGSS